MKPQVLGVGVIWSSPTFMKAASRTVEGIYLSTGPTTSETPELAAFGAEFLRNFEYKGLLQTYSFSGSGQSQVQINLSEVKDNRPVVLSLTMTT